MYLFLLFFMFFSAVLYGEESYKDTEKHKSIHNEFPSEKKRPKRGWEISGNFGVYRSNNYTAKFYNGARENVNNLDYVFSNYYWYQDIKEQLIIHAQRDSFQLYEIPADIKYNISMNAGFSGRFNYSDELAMNISANFTKIYVRDIFTLKLEPPYSGEIESYVICGIYGIENRNNIDIGFLYTVHPEKKITPFAEMGLHFNNTLVKKHFIRVYDREFNLINIYGSANYVPGVQLTEFDIQQGGIGFGTYISGGYRYIMNSYFSAEIAFTTYLNTINLEGYNKKFNLNNALLFRLVVSPKFNFSEDDNQMY